jgi:hypothetical protein
MVGVSAEIQTRHSRIQVTRITKWANMLWREGVECGASQWGAVITQYVHLAAEERVKMWHDPLQFHSTMHFIPTFIPNDRPNISGHIILRHHVQQDNGDWNAYRNVGKPSTHVTVKP